MKLTGMKVNNFLGIGKAELSFEGSGVTLVEGRNNDSTHASSNGAGKSSLLVESVLWGLYGITKRGLKGDDVINTHNAKEGCVIQIGFIVKGVEYSALRSRKHMIFKSNLTLEVYDDEGKGTDLTKGTAKETQVLLEEILGISSMVFSKMAFFGQGEVKPFADLSDKELKEMFDQALGLTFFSDNLAKIKGAEAELKREFSVLELKKTELENEKNIITEKAESIKRLIAESDRVAAEQKDIVNKDLARVESNLIELQKREYGIVSGDYDEDTINALTLKRAELEDLKDQLDKKHIQGRETLATVTSAYNTCIKAIDDNLRTIKRANDKIGKECPTCNQIFNEEGIRSYVSSLEGINDDNKVGAETKKADFVEKQSTVTQLETLQKGLIDKIKIVNTGLDGAKTLKRNAEEKVRLVEIQKEADKKAIIDLNETKKAKHVLLENIKNDTRKKAYEDEWDEKKIKLGVLADSIDEICENIHQLSKRQLLMKKLMEIMGNSGVKSYVFDSITPELNRFANELMKTLDPDIEIEISTVKKLKSGEIREKFSVNINNKNGAKSFCGNSGGEKAKVNLAIALAFNKLIRTMSEEEVPLCVLDEPFESLDAESSEHVVELLSKLDSDNIFIITHNDAVKDLVANKLTIEKRDGLAYLAA